jgi:hypothetical protein
MSNIDGFNPDYDDKKFENQIYFSEVKGEESKKYRKAELLFSNDGLLLNTKEDIKIEIKNYLSLYETDKKQQKYGCWLYEVECNGRNIPITQGLHIARRTTKGVVGDHEVTLNFEAIVKLKKFLNSLQFADFTKSEKYKLPLSEPMPQKIITPDEFQKMLLNIASIGDYEKVIAIKQRENAIKKLKDIINGNYKNEIEIQNFLRENLWLFGSEYAEFIDDTTINKRNKADGIPQTIDGYIDILEVKLPNEKLFILDHNHNNYYCSAELTKAIAQTQNYIYEMEQNIKENYEKNNNCMIVRPKGIVLFGSKDELSNDENKYLRMLNSSYHNLTIMTYQQLLKRAENSLIIKNNTYVAVSPKNISNKPIQNDNLPF